MARRPRVTELTLVSGDYFEMTRHAPSAFFEERCFDGAESLPDDVHRGHYLSTHERVQAFRQSSHLLFGRHWKLRSGLRQQRTIEVAHRQALNVRGCFELSCALGVPDKAHE